MKTQYQAHIENLLLTLLGFFFLYEALKQSFFFPYTDNEGAFVLIGREMGRGARLYADLWDHKPPFLFGQSWLLQMFFPLTEFHLHLYAFFIHALNAVLIFHLAKRLDFSRSGSWAAAMAYTLLLFPQMFQTWAVEADLLSQPFLLLSFAAAFSKKNWMNFLSGAFWVGAFMTKQSALFLLPAFLMASAFADIPKILRWAAGALLLTAAVMIPFALDGRWMEFNAALIGFNQYYIETGWRFFFATEAFRKFLVDWAKIAIAAYGLVFLTLVLGLTGKLEKPAHARTSYFLIVWLMGVLASCCVSGYFFTYYFIALLPPLALGVGLAWMKWQETRRKDLGFCFLALALGVMAVGTNFDGVRNKILSYAQYPYPKYYADKDMGALIASEAKPDDRLLAWDDEPQIYVYAGLRPFGKTPFINHLSAMPYEAWKLFKDFSAQPPRYCVISRDPQVLLPPDWLRTQLAKRYVSVKTIGELDLYRLRVTNQNEK
jgi:MFS family permease